MMHVGSCAQNWQNESRLRLCLFAVEPEGAFAHSEVTVKDKTQFQEMRSEFSIRTFLGRLLGSLAGVFIFMGVCTPFYADSASKVDWGLAVTMIAFGLFLGFCAARLIQSTR